ncbi:MAG: hypothetical protein ACLT4Y_11300 [Bifidobacterium breve]
MLLVGSQESYYGDGSNFLIRFREAVMKRCAWHACVVQAVEGYGATDVDLLWEAFGEDPDITLIICQTMPCG